MTHHYHEASIAQLLEGRLARRCPKADPGYTTQNPGYEPDPEPSLVEDKTLICIIQYLLNCLKLKVIKKITVSFFQKHVSAFLNLACS